MRYENRNGDAIAHPRMDQTRELVQSLCMSPQSPDYHCENSGWLIDIANGGFVYPACLRSTPHDQPILDDMSDMLKWVRVVSSSKSARYITDVLFSLFCNPLVILSFVFTTLRDHLFIIYYYVAYIYHSVHCFINLLCSVTSSPFLFSYICFICSFVFTF